MPYVDLQITKGASREQKVALVREFTDVLARFLGKWPEHTYVVFQEIAEEDWGIAGLLTDEFKWRERGEPPSPGRGGEPATWRLGGAALGQLRRRRFLGASG